MTPLAPLEGVTGYSVSLRPVQSDDFPNTSSSFLETAPPPIRPATPGVPRPSSPAAANRGIPLATRLLALLQPPLASVLAPEGPLDWYQELRPYQRVGIAVLVTRKETLLADDMGLGKTVQALGALRILFRRQEIESALIVTRAALIDQWRLELHLWAPELRVSVVRGPAREREWQWRTPVHVYLVGYETLRSDIDAGLTTVVAARDWNVVVLDEAQQIKNRDSQTSIALKSLQRQRSWALTGTPLETRLDDLESILEFLAPPPHESVARSLRSLPLLLSRQREVQLRRRKADVLPELPPKHVIRVNLELSPAQRNEYDRLERDGIATLTEMGETARVQHVLELIVRLKQACNFSISPRESAKVDDLVERLEEIAAEGHQALVFTQFVSDKYGAAAIAESLSRFHPLVYTGSLSSQERTRLLQTFRDDDKHKLLVLSLRAGGQGLNLQSASFVFHFDRWWNPAVENQATDRAHRLGQIRPVTVYKYVVLGTIEERIDELLRDRQQLFDQFVDETSLDLQRSLRAADLFGLFDLKPPGPAAHASGPVPGHVFSNMTGQQFEEFVKEKLEVAGWRVEVTPITRDGGIDLRAYRSDELGLESSLLVQCKNHVAPLGVESVRAFAGVLAAAGRGIQGLIVCPGGYTRDAQDFARRSGIQLWDSAQLDR